MFKNPFFQRHKLCFKLLISHFMMFKDFFFQGHKLCFKLLISHFMDEFMFCTLTVQKNVHAIMYRHMKPDITG